MNQMSGIGNTASSALLQAGVAFYFLSAVFMIAWQGLHSFSLMLLKVLWSNEGKAVLGSSIFYPTAAMMVLFVVARLVPMKVVTVCKCFCKRKALTAWKRIKMAMAKYETYIAKLTVLRTQIWASFRVLIAAVEMLCL